MSDIFHNFTYSRYGLSKKDSVSADAISKKTEFYIPKTMSVNCQSKLDSKWSYANVDSKITSSNSSKMHPRKPDSKIINYGTAGFRSNSNNLNSFIPFRVGILSTLRSQKHNGQTIGVIVTASHNPPADNGVKIVEPDGSMMKIEWEKYATKIANCEDTELENEIQEIISKENIDSNCDANIFVGFDTRETSPMFANAVIDGCNFWPSLSKNSVSVRNFGLVTTPQIHYLVVAENSKNLKVPYGKCSKSGYFEKLSKAFNYFMTSDHEMPTIDCANGVGAPTCDQFNKFLDKKLNLVNTNVEDYSKLNFNCGADFVKVGQKIPFSECDKFKQQNKKFVVFDGDADRIMYFFTDSHNKFHLLDGDKIASLLAKQLNCWLIEAQIDSQLAIIQTAYANGASTQFLKSVGIGTSKNKFLECAKTGVKHCHHKAQKFDIGIYFEANGHGTIIFKDQIKEKILESKFEPLINFVNLINETVGDALSIMLACEVCLITSKWTIQDWSKMYTELPNKQSKVKVADRSVIETFDEERQVAKPENLQKEIDKVVGEYKNGRSFVRPSGTEDVVRVYAEADTRESVDELASRVCKLVFEYAGGI